MDGAVYLAMPHVLLQRPAPTILFTYCTSQVRGWEIALRSDPRRMTAIDPDWAVPFHVTYDLQLPVVVMPKADPGIPVTVTGPVEQDPLARAYLRAHAGKEAARLLVEELGSPLADDKEFASGLSRGGLHALLLAAFDPRVTHVLSASGHVAFDDYVTSEGESLHGIYGRADLLQRNVHLSDVFALIRADTVLSFGLDDGYVVPGHFPVLRRLSERRRTYGLPPARLAITGPETKGHAWPRERALAYFANAISEP